MMKKAPKQPKPAATVSATDPAAVDALRTPLGFIELLLKTPLYDWQAKFLNKFDRGIMDRFKAALCTPNGAGKSERIIAGLSIWWVAVHPEGNVIITTKDSKQLLNQVIPAIVKHIGRFEGWRVVNSPHFKVTTATGGTILAYVTDEAGRAEGAHRKDDLDAPLLMIVDEAKSVADDIFEAIDRCTYNALLYVSSPGIKSGRFYNAFTRDIGFETMKVGLVDCPHIPQSKIDDIRKLYGDDHPFTLSSLHGEFMDEDGDSMFVVSPSSIRILFDSAPVAVPGKKYAFCDFAAGGDENVMALRDGNSISLTAWKDANTMSSVARFISMFIKEGLKPSDVYGDDSGLGRPIIDRMDELGWPINRVNNGAQAQEPDRFENRGAEMWHNAATAIANLGIVLPDDEKMKAQLTSRKIKFLSDGRMGVESKKDMAKRGITSPDRADACVGVIAIDTEIAAGEFDQDGLKRLEALCTSPKRGTLAKADFGVNWTDSNNGWLETWEPPTYGRAYIVSLKAGETGWSVFVLRKSMHDGTKQLNDAVVARISPCDWDAAMLTDRVDLMLQYYGNPVIVPDALNGMDIIERLKEKGTSIYRRPVFDRQATGDQFVYGWNTTAQNVTVAIAAVARAVREGNFDLPCQTAVRDLRRFRRSVENGDTLAIGIGLQCLEAAHVFTPPQIIPMRGAMVERNGSLQGSGACK